jgi:hypothetical protein
MRAPPRVALDDIPLDAACYPSIQFVLLLAIIQQRGTGATRRYLVFGFVARAGCPGLLWPERL